ncbi:MAG: carboxypeptidase-like regulatory domain-containing protein [Planctomycetota bacterium]|nr:carboxypeptidase-like regulatory domain-containing protein [Planctomycetota bacterium]
MKTYVVATLAAAVLFTGLVLFLLAGFSDGKPLPGDDAAVSTREESGGPPVEPAPEATPRGGAPAPPPEKPPEVVARPQPPEEDPPPVVRPLAEGRCLLTVAVTDASGIPIPRVFVVLQSGLAEKRSETGIGGEVIFSDIAEGAYSYFIESRDRPRLRSAQPVELEDGEEEYILLQLSDYRSSIAGRVRDRDGNPVRGIDVLAIQRLFPAGVDGDPGAAKVVVADQGAQRSRSGPDGRYAIDGLDDGEYELKTIATRLYPSTRAVVRAGTDTADLIVVASREVRVGGQVSAVDGTPLGGVRVIPMRQATRGTRSDEDGWYDLSIVYSPGVRDYQLRFVRDGYRETRETLKGDLEELDEVRLDVRLEPLGQTAVVSGRLLDVDRRPVVGETVTVLSAALKVKEDGVSDEEGRFSVPAVPVGTGYELRVEPRSGLQDYRRRSLAVPPGGLELEVLLLELATGELEGRMVDAAGAPVPRFRLWLQSSLARSRPLEVAGDDEGAFQLEDVPEGRLTFETRSLPQIHVTGLTFTREGRQDVELVIDQGSHDLRGVVVDPAGTPVPGARVYLYWSHRHGQLRSTANRKTVAGPRGTFQFTQLGPGPHRVNVVAPGYRSFQEAFEVGKGRGEIEVRLRAAAPR